MIFDENTFCGKIFNDVINLSLDSFVKKYEAKSESIETSLRFPEITDFILNNSTTLRISTDKSPNRITSCQCQFKELNQMEEFIKTIQKNNLFEYDNFMGSFYYYPENIKGLIMNKISIYAEKTMFYYFVELTLIY